MRIACTKHAAVKQRAMCTEVTMGRGGAVCSIRLMQANCAPCTQPRTGCAL